MFFILNLQFYVREFHIFVNIWYNLFWLFFGNHRHFKIRYTYPFSDEGKNDNWETVGPRNHMLYFMGNRAYFVILDAFLYWIYNILGMAAKIPVYSSHLTRDTLARYNRLPVCIYCIMIFLIVFKQLVEPWQLYNNFFCSIFKFYLSFSV